jgi:GNAT superfamily N-acetyltransferase
MRLVFNSIWSGGARLDHFRRAAMGPNRVLRPQYLGLPALSLPKAADPSDRLATPFPSRSACSEGARGVALPTPSGASYDVVSKIDVDPPRCTRVACLRIERFELMLVLLEDVTLFDVQQSVEVQARLVRLTRDLAARRIDGEWWNLEVPRSLRAEEDDHHWSWKKIVGEHRSDRSWEALAVESAGGAIEGAIVYRIDALSRIDLGEGTVYADRLATAPRNRRWLVGDQSYQGVGTVLLLAAVRHRYLLGLGGRVLLTSLPRERTRDFYAQRGFEVIFEREDGMIDFELPTAKAVAWLEDEGYL